MKKETCRTALSTLVNLRSRVLENISTRVGSREMWMWMDQSLRRLIADRLKGGCRLERLEWVTSDPVDDLEVLVRGEQVHPVESLEKLKMRFEGSKRVYVLKHEELHARPLLATYVSLCQKIPVSMGDIEEETYCEDETCSVAAFYSINNMERGVKGIDLGQGMIHRVVDVLKKEFPSTLETCVTLSPIPGFRSWVWESLKNMSSRDGMRLFNDDADTRALEERVYVALGNKPHHLLVDSLLALENAQHVDPDLYSLLEKPLVRLCRIYLETRVDPVFRFHVENGAHLHRINPHADMTWQGRHYSYGLMANYLYPM
jgi:malonyl-CoA decarboxylase